MLVITFEIVLEIVFAFEFESHQKGNFGKGGNTV